MHIGNRVPYRTHPWCDINCVRVCGLAVISKGVCLLSFYTLAYRPVLIIVGTYLCIRSFFSPLSIYNGSKSVSINTCSTCGRKKTLQKNHVKLKYFRNWTKGAAPQEQPCFAIPILFSATVFVGELLATHPGGEEG